MFEIDPKVKFQESLGAKIKRIREERGIEAKAVASHLGVTPGYICEVEAGRRNISAFLAWQIEKVLGPIETKDIEL